MTITIPYCLVNKDDIKCFNVKNYQYLNSKIVRIILNTIPSHILFETKTPLRILCSGISFQSFIWGSTSYFLWFLNKIDNICIIIEGTITPITSKIYFIGRKTGIPSYILEKFDHIIYLSNIVRKLSNIEGILFLIEDKLVKDLFIPPFLSINDKLIDKITNYIRELLKRKYEDNLIDQITKYILEHRIPLELFDHPDMLIHIIREKRQ